MAVFDLEAYKQKLKAAGVTDDLLTEIDTGIKPGFMRQDDYSRRQQDLQQKELATNQFYSELQQYENSILALEQQSGIPRDQWPAHLQARAAAANPDGSNTMPNANANVDYQKMITTALEQQRAELETKFNTQLETLGQGMVGFAEFLVEARDHWQSAYGVPFPRDEFKKFMQDNSHTNPQHALAIFEQPHKEKKQNDEWERKIAEAETRGEQRAYSRGLIPEPGSGLGSWATGGGAIVSLGGAMSGTSTANNGTALTPQQERELIHQRADKELSRLINIPNSATQ